MKQHKGINFLRKEEYIICDFSSKTVSVIVEERTAPGANVSDHSLTLRHEVRDRVVTFESYYKGEQIVVPISSGRYDIGEFKLPEGLVGFTRERIHSAINWYIDRLMS